MGAPWLGSLRTRAGAGDRTVLRREEDINESEKVRDEVITYGPVV
jgi:hypothetical protein